MAGVPVGTGTEAPLYGGTARSSIGLEQVWGRVGPHANRKRWSGMRVLRVAAWFHEQAARFLRAMSVLGWFGPSVLSKMTRALSSSGRAAVMSRCSWSRAATLLRLSAVLG